MMKKLEEAIIYATVMHQGKVRKLTNVPYILHPIEVAQILSTLTEDEEIITAGILHDIVESTDGTMSEIEKRFGKRVAFLVDSDSETKFDADDSMIPWKKRKEEALRNLQASKDTGVQMLWLADTLSNMRSLAGLYSEKGESMWQYFNESDSELQRWYYSSVAETVELTLNKSGAFKELIKHVNFIWPGTFDSDKTRYKKYREVSVEGCKVLGRGAKGEVYRYDDELVIKVFNLNNTYHDVEQEIALTRKAFILGIPTAISFGIVSVGEQYGAMYELLETETISELVARNPAMLETYAGIMAELARTIHSITVTDEDGFPPEMVRLRKYVKGGVDIEDPNLAVKCMKLLDTIEGSDTLVHGDFHTNNVFLLNGEPLLIDLDRLSTGHPIAEISDLYYFYVALGEDDPSVVEKFMGFPYEMACRFFEIFLRKYLGTDDEAVLNDVMLKAKLLSNVRTVNRIHKKQVLSDADQAIIDRSMATIAEAASKLRTLEFRS